MKRVLMSLLCIVTSAFFASGAAAQMEYGSEGAYFLIGGLNGFNLFKNTEDAPIKDSFGFEVKGGWRFNDYLAAEVDLNILSGWDFTVDFGTPPGPGIPQIGQLTIDGGLFTANAVAYYPVGRFHPFAMVGVGVMWSRLRTTYPVGTVCTPSFYGWWCNDAYAQFGSASSFAAKFGGGLDFYVTDEWAITLDASYVMPVGTLEDLRYISLGWGARFMF